MLATPEIIDQPQLSLMDGSGTDAVRFFDTMAIDYPDVVQAAATQPELVDGSQIRPPESFLPADTVGATAYRQQQAASAIYDLLAESRDGRGLDYDGATWAEIMADSIYHAASKIVKASRETSDSLSKDRRTVAVRGLAIYAARRHMFAMQSPDHRLPAGSEPIRPRIPVQPQARTSTA